jgi:hypothetical protein
MAARHGFEIYGARLLIASRRALKRNGRLFGGR